MLAYLEAGPFGIGYELFPVNKRIARKFERKTGHESLYYQTDWDFPSLARDLGWRGPSTRSTWPEYSEVGQAGEFLDSKVGCRVRVPDELFGV